MNMKKNKSLSEYRAVIFDLDGTLYFQTKLRLMMACRLGGYYCTHFWKMKDLLILKRFREVREHWERIGAEEAAADKAAMTKAEEQITVQLDEAQYCHVAAAMKLSPDRVRSVVEDWMYEKPLETLMECRDEALVDLLNVLREQEILILIYSDYPVTDKLAALDIQADQTYSALDADIMSLKPDPKGLRTILSQNHFKPSEVLMVGDRMSKDGQAAINAGVDYIILEKSAAAREKLYDELIQELTAVK